MRPLVILTALFLLQTSSIYAGKSLKEQFILCMEMKKELVSYTNGIIKEVASIKSKKPADTKAYMKSFFKKSKVGTKFWEKMFATHEKLEDGLLKIDSTFEKGYSDAAEALWKYGDYHMEAVDAVWTAMDEEEDYGKTISTAQFRFDRALGRLSEYNMYMDDYMKKYLMP